MLTKKEANRLAKAHCEQGKLIEAGWVSGPLRSAPAEVGEVQLWAMRAAYFLGARHLLLLIMSARKDKVSKGVMTELLRELHEELIEFSLMDEAAQDKYEKDNGPVH